MCFFYSTACGTCCGLVGTCSWFAFISALESWIRSVTLLVFIKTNNCNYFLLILQTSVFLNLGSVSWFEANGYGCIPVYSTNITDEAAVWPVRPERVDNCLLGYDIVELIHSGAQLALSVWNLN